MSPPFVSSKWIVVWFIAFAIAVVILVMFGAFEFLPAWKTKDFSPVKCKIVDMQEKTLHCVCGEQCFSRFSCLSIFVEFADLNSQVSRRAKCANDELTFLSFPNERLCSYYPKCNFKTEHNNADVAEFQATLTTGETRTCYVRGGNQSEIILNKKNTSNPITLLVIASSLFLLCQLSFFMFTRSVYTNVTGRKIRSFCQS